MSCRQRRGKRSSLGIYSDWHERSCTSCPCVLTVSPCPPGCAQSHSHVLHPACPREGTGAVLSTAIWRSLKPSEDQTRDRPAGHYHELAPGEVPSFLWEMETQPQSEREPGELSRDRL